MPIDSLIHPNTILVGESALWKPIPPNPSSRKSNTQNKTHCVKSMPIVSSSPSDSSFHPASGQFPLPHTGLQDSVKHQKSKKHKTYCVFRKGWKESIIKWLQVRTVTAVSSIGILLFSLPILLGCEMLSNTEPEGLSQSGLNKAEVKSESKAEVTSREQGDSEVREGNSEPEGRALEQSIGANQPLPGSTFKKIHSTQCVKGEGNSKTAPLPTHNWVTHSNPDNTPADNNLPDNTLSDNTDNNLAPDSSDSPSVFIHLIWLVPLIVLLSLHIWAYFIVKGEGMAAKKTEMITKWFSRKIAIVIAAIVLLLPVSLKEPVWFAVCLTALSICFLICNVLEKKWSKEEKEG
jgi:hypothetical protein